MRDECTSFPELNHEVCQLQPHEKVVAKFFESRGLDVERLCAAKSSGKAPDFRLTGKENFVCICEAIEGDAICRKAQRQIVDRLKYESEREKVVRLVVIFLEQNLLFEYFPKIGELEFDVNRRILSKFPKFSTVAFCENFDSRFSHANFLVFHTANTNIPSLPRNIFDDGYSFQFPR